MENEMNKQGKNGNKNKGRYDGKRHKSNNRKFSKHDRDVSDFKGAKNTERKSTTNDLSWYMHNVRLVTDAARIPFGNQLGRKLDGKLFGYQPSVPGICAIKVVPGPGIANSVIDAVNISATNIFQFIRKNLSTYSAYHAADVMMYVMAVDELYAWYNYLVRLFGVANTFSATNLYYPKALLMANGINSANINVFRENMNDLRAQFNSLIYKAASIYMPVDIDIVKRHMWMFGNYFIDANSAKAQTYMYVPAGYHLLDEVSSSQGTMMKWYPMPESFSVAEALDVFNQMIESIRGSDSMLKIAADMRRAYENSSSWTLSYIDEGLMVIPTKDELVLEQIMNSVIHDADMCAKLTFDVTQSVEKNMILYKPRGDISELPEVKKQQITSFANYSETDGVILNFYKENPEVGDIVEGSRNMSLYRVSGNTVAFYTSGADICVGATIFVKIPDGTGDFEFDTYKVSSYVGITADYAAIDVIKLAGFMHTFNWFPNVYICNPSASSLYVPFISFDNYTQVNGDTVARLNEAVMTSMWQVPDFKLPTNA